MSELRQKERSRVDRDLELEYHKLLLATLKRPRLHAEARKFLSFLGREWPEGDVALLDRVCTLADADILPEHYDFFLTVEDRLEKMASQLPRVSRIMSE